MKKILNEGNQIHSFISSSGSAFLKSYGSGSTSQKVTVPTVPIPQRCSNWQDSVLAAFNNLSLFSGKSKAYLVFRGIEYFLHSHSTYRVTENGNPSTRLAGSEPVLRIRDFWYGSGSTDPYFYLTDPALYYFFKKFFCSLLFQATFTPFFKDKK
jgi:hypothetical protein